MGVELALSSWVVHCVDAQWFWLGVVKDIGPVSGDGVGIEREGSGLCGVGSADFERCRCDDFGGACGICCR